MTKILRALYVLGFIIAVGDFVSQPHWWQLGVVLTCMMGVFITFVKGEQDD